MLRKNINTDKLTYQKELSVLTSLSGRADSSIPLSEMEDVVLALVKKILLTRAPDKFIDVSILLDKYLRFEAQDLSPRFNKAITTMIDMVIASPSKHLQFIKLFIPLRMLYSLTQNDQKLNELCLQGLDLMKTAPQIIQVNYAYMLDDMQKTAKITYLLLKAKQLPAKSFRKAQPEDQVLDFHFSEIDRKSQLLQKSILSQKKVDFAALAELLQ